VAVFGLQFSEILMILVLALILLGPKKLPQIAKSLARGLKEVRRASQDLRDVWENEVEKTAGPELRSLRNLRDPGSLVDSAWDATRSKSDGGEAEAQADADGDTDAEGANAEAEPDTRDGEAEADDESQPGSASPEKDSA